MYKDSRGLLTKEIPLVFSQNKKGMIFPKGYINNVRWWGNIPRQDLHSLLPDGTAKLLTMDVDIGDTCSLNCPHCFRRDPRFDMIKGNALKHEETVHYIKEAQKLGLKQIKILGRGEPFENPRFLEFLREMDALGIGVSIFTKGHVLGNDDLAKKYNYDNYGIGTGEQLIQAIKKLNVSILLGFNSFDRETQEKFTGIDQYPESSPVKNYVEFRDRALINLVKAGFNKYEENKATRLAMIAAPIKPENVDEIFDIYAWARPRNIYMLTCPTTISGKGIDEFERQKMFSGYISQLENLYSKIYIWAIKTNLIPMEKFRQDGVSLYPGCHVCNQVAAGFFLNLSGQVNQCPGRVDKNTIFSKNIKQEKSLKDAWINCTNCKRAQNTKGFNYHCVARDGLSLPVYFYENIEEKVLQYFGIIKNKPIEESTTCEKFVDAGDGDKEF